MAMVQSLERAAFELSRVLPAFSARSFNAGSKAFFPPLKGLSPIPSASASSFSVPSIRVNSGRGFASFPGDSFAYLSPRRTPAHLGLIVVAQQAGCASLASPVDFFRPPLYKLMKFNVQHKFFIVSLNNA